MRETIVVQAVEGCLVPDIAAREAGMLRYIGYKWDKNTRNWEQTWEDVKLPLERYYIKAIEKGELVLVEEG